MADQIKIKAAEGRRVLDPVTRQPIPEGGITVSVDDVFWWKRLDAGDVVEVKDTDTKAAAPKPAARAQKE